MLLKRIVYKPLKINLLFLNDSSLLIDRLHAVIVDILQIIRRVFRTKYSITLGGIQAIWSCHRHKPVSTARRIRQTGVAFLQDYMPVWSQLLTYSHVNTGTKMDVSSIRSIVWGISLIIRMHQCKGVHLCKTPQKSPTIYRSGTYTVECTK